MSRFVLLEEDEEEKKDNVSKQEKKPEDDKSSDNDEKKNKDDDYTSDADSDDILSALDDDTDDETSDDSPSTSGIFESMAQLVYVYTVIACNMQHIHLHASGKKFDNIHNMAEEQYRHFRYRVDGFAEIALQGDVKLDNIGNAKQHVDNIEFETNDHYSYEDACRAMDKNLKAAIEALNTARSMGDSRTDIQSTLDDELGWIHQQSSYFMNRRLNDPISESANLFNFEIK